MAEEFSFVSGAARLFAERSGAGPVTVLLLHSGVGDRRSWGGVGARLSGHCTVISYDRRGYGASKPSTDPFRHVDDLLTLTRGLDTESVWLVGSSVGGGLAVDCALLAPGLIEGLILLAPAIPGAPEPTEIDPATLQLFERYEAAAASQNLDEMNRLSAWLWLDGPAQLEGRVAGDTRELFLSMNREVLEKGQDENAGASDVDTWSRLAELNIPTVVACGEFDLPPLLTTCGVLSEKLRGDYLLLDGVAHLPYLEQPALVADLARRTLRDH